MTANALVKNPRKAKRLPHRLSHLFWVVFGGISLLALSQILLQPPDLRASSHFFYSPGAGPGGGDPEPTLTPDPITADLAVTISVTPSKPLYGQIITYTIVVTNQGPDKATATKIKESLPAEVTIINWVAGDGVYDPDANIWAIPWLSDQAAAKLIITAKTNTCPTDGKPISSRVTRQWSSPPDPNSDNDTSEAWLTVVCADLTITEIVHPQNQLTTGSRLDYLITVTNQGPFTATEVTITSTLPDPIQYQGHILTYSHTYTNQVWTLLNPLAKGESVVLQLRARVSCSVLGNEPTLSVVAVKGFEPDLEMNNNVDSAGVEVEPGDSCRAYLPVVSKAPPCRIETFDNPNSGWGFDISTGPPTSLQYIDGKYYMFAQNQRGIHWSRSPNFGPYLNYTVRVDARWVSPERHNAKEYGIIFDHSNNLTMYRFNIDPSSNVYVLGKLENSWETLLTGTSSDILSSTAVNTLEVRREGYDIKLFINGNYQDTYSDYSPLPRAYMGINVFRDDVDGEVYFDNFVICSSEMRRALLTTTSPPESSSSGLSPAP